MRGWGAHLPRTPPCGRSSSLVPYESLSIRTTQSLPPINGWRPVLVIPSGQSGHANERPNTCPSRSSRRGTAFLGRSQPGWRPPPVTPPRRAEPAPERARGLPPPAPASRLHAGAPGRRQALQREQVSESGPRAPATRLRLLNPPEAVTPIRQPLATNFRRAPPNSVGQLAPSAPREVLASWALILWSEGQHFPGPSDMQGAFIHIFTEEDTALHKTGLCSKILWLYPRILGASQRGALSGGSFDLPCHKAQATVRFGLQPGPATESSLALKPSEPR